MKNAKRLKIIILIISCLSAEMVAQDVWSKIDDTTFELNNIHFESILKSVSKEQHNSVNIQFPNNEGELTSFSVIDNSLLPEKLALKYPNVHAYKGTSVKNPELSVTFTCTPNGISATLIKGTKVWSLQQFEHTNIYELNEDDNNDVSVRINCQTSSEANNSNNLFTSTNTSAKTQIGDNTLRILRAAITVTGEYSDYFVNKANAGSSTDAVKKAAVLGGIVTSINNLNAVFERDLGVRFELIDNNDELIFLDTNTDPYTTTNANTLIDIAGEQIISTIGFDNFDIGHLFSVSPVGFDGLAEVAGLCSTRKGQAISSATTPEGTFFDFTLLAHEIGHQLGANHTQNYTCQRNDATAMEPGSGSTIMGYAGACDSFVEIQPSSDEYFHLVSIDQIRSHLQFVACHETTIVNNNNPFIQDLPDYTIPADTAFALEAPVIDEDNDVLTYCWEQMDNELATSPPVSTSEVGPLFRSLPPTTSPNRNFPEFFDNSTEWEVLPTVSRSMEFGLTVRDGNPGGIATSRVSINVINTDEKFEVTTPSLGTRFAQNSFQEITWNVAGTNANEIDTENVRIEMSFNDSDGFTTILADNTPNDGSEFVGIPIGRESSDARIRISAIDNIYYTIQESTFVITEELINTVDPITGPINGEIDLFVNKKQTPEFEFHLYDLTGRELLSTIETEETPKIDVSTFESGLYIVKIILGSQIFTQKILID